MFIGWQPSAKRELLKLDQKLVLDRFMSKHQAWATQSRAVESMAAGDARRAQEAIDKLTKYNVCGSVVDTRSGLISPGQRYRNEHQSV
jgi:hypothetical protein